MSLTRITGRLRIALLAVALICFAGALALSYLAPRYQISDWISFTVMSGYVVFMLLFLLSLPEPPEPEAGPPQEDESGDQETKSIGLTATKSTETEGID